MGVACPQPNSVKCDTVKLSGALTQPARQVTGSIGGRAFPLRLGECLAPQHGRNFCGTLHPAGLIQGDGPLRVHAGRDNLWFGEGNSHKPVVAPVTVTIHRPDGSTETVTERIRLNAGFG